MSETQTAATTDAAEADDTEKPDVKTTEGAEQTEAKGEGEGDKPETEADAEPKPKPTPWWDKRIAVLTAKKASTEQLLAEANARLAALEGRTPEPQQPNGEMTEAEFNRRVEERAAQKAAQNAHATRLQLMIETGNKEFTPAEFTAKSNTLAGLGATENAAFMAELTDSENGHKIVAYLGDHPEEAERMLALPANRIAREMAKMDMKVGQAPAAKPVSRAPAPVNPVNGGGRLEASLEDPNLPVEKWIELRNKEIAKKKGH